MIVKIITKVITQTKKLKIKKNKPTYRSLCAYF